MQVYSLPTLSVQNCRYNARSGWLSGTTASPGRTRPVSQLCSVEPADNTRNTQPPPQTDIRLQDNPIGAHLSIQQDRTVVESRRQIRIIWSKNLFPDRSASLVQSHSVVKLTLQRSTRRSNTLRLSKSESTAAATTSRHRPAHTCVQPANALFTGTTVPHLTSTVQSYNRSASPHALSGASLA